MNKISRDNVTKDRRHGYPRQVVRQKVRHMVRLRGMIRVRCRRGLGLVSFRVGLGYVNGRLRVG